MSFRNVVSIVLEGGREKKLTNGKKGKLHHAFPQQQRPQHHIIVFNP